MLLFSKALTASSPFFLQSDDQPFPMLEVVYKASCWDCQDFYIGKTKRTLHDKKGSQVPVMQTDRQTDRHVFIWGLIQRKYIDYNSK